MPSIRSERAMSPPSLGPAVGRDFSRRPRASILVSPTIVWQKQPTPLIIYSRRWQFVFEIPTSQGTDRDLSPSFTSCSAARSARGALEGPSGWDGERSVPRIYPDLSKNHRHRERDGGKTDEHLLLSSFQGPWRWIRSDSTVPWERGSKGG